MVVTKSGYRIGVVNVGNPKLDMVLNYGDLDTYLTNRQVDKKLITFCFDNRTIPRLVWDYVRGRDEVPQVPRRISDLGAVFGIAQGIPENRQILVNTQEAATEELLGLGSIEKVLRHEIEHLEHDQEWCEQNDTPKMRLKRKMNLGGLAVYGFSMGLIGRGLITHIQEGSGQKVVMSAALFVGGWILTRRSIHGVLRNKPEEAAALEAENSYSELKLVKRKPEYFLKRILR